MNTHKNPPEFWGLDDEWAVKRGFAPACPITYNSRCEGCIYRHECEMSEYEDKDPEKTFVLRYDEFNKCYRWVEVLRNDGEGRGSERTEAVSEV